MTIKRKKIRVTGWRDAQAGIQLALKREGVPATVAKRVTLNGAVPGDGVSKGSICSVTSPGGGVSVLTRVSKWATLESFCNERRDELARFARECEALRKWRDNPITRATLENPSRDELGRRYWRWWCGPTSWGQIVLIQTPSGHYIATITAGERRLQANFSNAESALDYLQDAWQPSAGYFSRRVQNLPVIFRAERSGDFKGSVTAVFPTLAADRYGMEFTIYAHIGQHGAAHRGWYNQTRRATVEESADLLQELRGIYESSLCEGDPVFKLVPVARMTQDHEKAMRLHCELMRFRDEVRADV